MAWLDVPDDAATAELERLTEPWRRQGQRVPPVMGVLKAQPKAFEAVLAMNYALTFGASSLGRRREELIAVWVSALNGCFFCLATHARYLEAAWDVEADLKPLLGGIRELAAEVRESRCAQLIEQSAALAPLAAADRELLSFVAEITWAPESRSRTDHTRLSLAGYTDAEILDSVLVAACFAFMNRLASATGVALDGDKHAAAQRMFGASALERHLAWAEGPAEAP